MSIDKLSNPWGPSPRWEKAVAIAIFVVVVSFFLGLFFKENDVVKVGASIGLIVGSCAIAMYFWIGSRAESKRIALREKLAPKVNTNP